MIRTFVTPSKCNFNLILDLPQDYLGQELEIIVFKKQEGLIINKPENKMSDFVGIFSDNEYQNLKQLTEQSREEWNRNF